MIHCQLFIHDTNKYCLFLVYISSYLLYVAVPVEPWWRRPSLFYTFTRGVLLCFNITFAFLIICSILVTFHAEANFQIMHCFQDGVQQSTLLIDLVSAFDFSAASYPFSMLYVSITQWFVLLTDQSSHPWCLAKMFSFCSSWVVYVADANLCSNHKQTCQH